MISLADTLDALAGHLPTGLVSREAYAQARRVAATLPAALTSWTYLECRLGPEPGPMDLIVEVNAAGRDVLTGENGPQAISPALRGDPLWRRVTELCRHWADPHSPLHRAIDCLWLEFDVGECRPGRVPQPGVFVGFTPDAARSSATAEASLAVLLGAPLDPGRRRALRRCWQHLPSGACILYAGVLLPRGQDVLRVCPADVPARDLPRYLRDIGWPGPIAPLEAALDEMDGVRDGSPARDPALAHLDVGAGVLPRLGLEYVFGRPQQVRGRLVEQAFLDLLVERGLCTRAKRDALAGFPGWSLENLPHELWRSVVLRRVNHVKLVLEAGHPPQAKGYLCLHHRFWRHAVSRPAALAAV